MRRTATFTIATSILLVWILISDNPYQGGNLKFNRTWVFLVPAIAFATTTLYTYSTPIRKLLYNLVICPFAFGLYNLIYEAYILKPLLGEDMVWSAANRILANALLYTIPTTFVFVVYMSRIKRHRLAMMERRKM